MRRRGIGVARFVIRDAAGHIHRHGPACARRDGGCVGVTRTRQGRGCTIADRDVGQRKARDVFGEGEGRGEGRILDCRRSCNRHGRSRKISLHRELRGHGIAIARRIICGIGGHVHGNRSISRRRDRRGIGVTGPGESRRRAIADRNIAHGETGHIFREGEGGGESPVLDGARTGNRDAGCRDIGLDRELRRSRIAIAGIIVRHIRSHIQRDRTISSRGHRRRVDLRRGRREARQARIASRNISQGKPRHILGEGESRGEGASLCR